MKLFNIINSLTIIALSIGANVTSAQVPTFVKTTDTFIKCRTCPTFSLDLNNDGRDDLVSLSPTGFASDAPGTGINFGVNPPVQQYSYALLKVSVQLNRPDGTFGPIQETVLPLVTDLARAGVGNQLNFRSVGVQIAKLSAGSKNYGLILTQVASSAGVNINDYSQNINLQNSVTLQGNGDGTFGKPVITIGFVADGAPADLTGAGYHAQYVKIGDNLSGNRNMLIHGLKSDGTFTINPLSEVPIQSNDQPIFIKDYNNDGKDDTVIRTYVGDKIISSGGETYSLPIFSHAIFSGSGTLTAPTLTKSFSFPFDNIADGWLWLGDFNGDGFIDFLEYFPGITRLYLNNGANNPGSIAVTNDSALVGLASTISVEGIADLDGDGKDDLLAENASTHSRLFYRSNGNGTFQAPQQLDIPNTSNGEIFYLLQPINIGSRGIPSLLRFADITDVIAGTSDAKYEFYQNTLDLSVNSITMLAISAVNPVPGQGITFTATVTGKKPGGVVNFSDGTASLGSVPLVGGQASLTLPAGLASGAHNITANFPSDFRNKASSVSRNITVGKVASQSSLTTLADVVESNTPVVLTTKVTGTNPTGAVVYIGEDGKEIGRATLVGGTANLRIVFSKGKYVIKANYLGDTANLASTSNTIEIKVKKFNERKAKFLDESQSLAEKASEIGSASRKLFNNWTRYLSKIFGTPSNFIR